MEVVSMTRDEVYKDIEETLGLVPSFMKDVPDETLEHDWKAFKAIQLDETLIPGKYKELIGLGLSAVTKCRYCIYFHTEAAKLNGATDDEIKEALRYAGNSTLWSTFIQGTQQDYDQFADETRRIVEHIKSKSGQVETPERMAV